MKLTTFGRLPRYALVIAGGYVDGQRPRTALFILHGIRPDGDYQGQRLGAKSRRRVLAGDCVAIWRGMPSDKQVRAMRAKLPVLGESGVRSTKTAREALKAARQEAA